ncbi:hypothetical protein [Rathayibacter rathayi]|uniref:hypothetical protein n=1 Tax=Rathayibacter rathayi TaxID=33887 RepID=UPI000BD74D0E|nr:hypothetical protein [Rathayibacter rathayi]MWV74759.1 hypothetical protein [Rathayibacter rathayi NCPPB 2980 = VKM Ac-1601]TWD64399.1 hypothetical protein FB469_2881 [Rathayibacter rathayi]SOE04206.1 hypothetical protein SAMN06295924_103261 [Rathayibacter rathayi NCPPB 2980 = VKM Ac-1601]
MSEHERDAALDDEITSIHALGEGRGGETAGPEDEDHELSPEQDAQIESELKNRGNAS